MKNQFGLTQFKVTTSDGSILLVCAQDKSDAIKQVKGGKSAIAEESFYTKNDLAKILTGSHPDQKCSITETEKRNDNQKRN